MNPEIPKIEFDSHRGEAFKLRGRIQAEVMKLFFQVEHLEIEQADIWQEGGHSEHFNLIFQEMYQSRGAEFIDRCKNEMSVVVLEILARINESIESKF